MDKNSFMEEALIEAKKALKKGEVPIGAVVVLGEDIIGRGYNQPITNSDPTAHAEIMALRDAAMNLKNYRLKDTLVFTTLEPCLMCAGALVHARIKKLIYSASDPKSGVIESNGNLMQSAFLNHKISYEGGILKEDSSEILKNFFLKKRS
ncbi:MAG: tRNA adenosine(34) deaminase TadA [SAR86 cluster bacterium]|nr:tRNA adenosine(34) deaminase TadA [SAR86 cluster bacterium]